MKTKRFNSIFQRLFQPAFGEPQVLAGNQAEAESEILLGNAAGGAATFAILQPDGMFIPYGEYPHKQGIQKFEKADAEIMAANHRSLLGKLARLATGGCPVYIDPPDQIEPELSKLRQTFLGSAPNFRRFRLRVRGLFHCLSSLRNALRIGFAFE